MNDFTELEYINISSKDNLVEDVWVYAVGNWGDLFMLYSILIKFHNKYPDLKVKMVENANSISLFRNNPAISLFGFPPKNSTILKTDYWNRIEFKRRELKPLQILSKMFSLESTNIDQLLFDNVNIDNDDVLINLINWKDKNILIAPFAESQNSIMFPMKWHNLVNKFSSDKVLFLQLGNEKDVHIKGAYSLLGLMTHLQIINLLKHIDLVITLDNYMIQLSNLTDTPAIVLLGPSRDYAQTFVKQKVIFAPIPENDSCIECVRNNYHNSKGFDCNLPLEKKCMNQISDTQISSLISMFLYK